MESVEAVLSIKLACLLYAFDRLATQLVSHILTDDARGHCKRGSQAKTSTKEKRSTSTVLVDLNNDIVLLATANDLVKARSGAFYPCRALLDSGSQQHFTTRYANQLQTKKIRTSNV